MGTVGSVLKKWQALKPKLEDNSLASDAITETSDKFLELNKQQLLSGKGNDGEALGTYKSAEYAAMKNKLNPLPGYGIKDHRLTGSYYKGMFLKVDNDKIVQGSTDEKEKYLNKGRDFGLSEESHNTYVNDTLQPTIIEKIKEELK